MKDKRSLATGTNLSLEWETDLSIWLEHWQNPTLVPQHAIIVGNHPLGQLRIYNIFEQVHRGSVAVSDADRCLKSTAFRAVIVSCKLASLCRACTQVQAHTCVMVCPFFDTISASFNTYILSVYTFGRFNSSPMCKVILKIALNLIHPLLAMWSQESTHA